MNDNALFVPARPDALLLAGVPCTFVLCAREWREEHALSVLALRAWRAVHELTTLHALHRALLPCMHAPAPWPSHCSAAQQSTRPYQQRRRAATCHAQPSASYTGDPDAHTLPCTPPPPCVHPAPRSRLPGQAATTPAPINACQHSQLANNWPMTMANITMTMANITMAMAKNTNWLIILCCRMWGPAPTTSKPRPPPQALKGPNDVFLMIVVYLMIYHTLCRM